MIKSGKLQTTIEEAVSRLKSGEVVAIPTETVYGLAAVASNLNAVKKIFETKARPTTDPLILHISEVSQLNEIVENVSEIAWQLIKSFWPGPITIVFKKKKSVDGLLTANLDTVAVRMPKHEMALEIIKKVGEPLAAPSANRFQSISPTNATAVEQELGARLSLIVDGGACESGIESTVISCVDDKPRVLRLGAVTLEDLELALGKPITYSKSSSEKESVSQVSPGLLSFHYAPRTALKAVKNELELFEQIDLNKKNVAVIVYSKNEAKAIESAGVKCLALSPGGDIKEAAQNFFAQLRAADQLRVEKIFVMLLPDSGLGRAINDRIIKAQHN